MREIFFCLNFFKRFQFLFLFLYPLPRDVRRLLCFLFSPIKLQTIFLLFHSPCDPTNDRKFSFKFIDKRLFYVFWEVGNPFNGQDIIFDFIGIHNLGQPKQGRWSGFEDLNRLSIPMLLVFPRFYWSH